MVKQGIFYPLTHPQKGIWYTEKFYPGTGIANLIGTMRLRHNLDFTLLKRALNLVIRDNDALRLRIIEDANGPRQYVSNYEEREFEFLDFSAGRGWDDFVAWIEQDGEIPLHNIDSDLFKFVIYKLAEGDGGFYLKAHHTIVDAWAMVLVGNQVNYYYTQLLKGEENPSVQWPSYIDFIEAEGRYETSPQFQINRDFWRHKFDTLPEMTTLKPNRPVFGPCAARRRTFSLTREITVMIDQYARQLGVSGFILFLAALAAYINRVTGKDDMVLGAPVFNRPTAQEKMMMGMLIEIVPVRLTVHGDQDFESFVRDVAGQWREMRKHQHPYGLILEEIRSRHKLTANLYDIMLNFQNARFDLDLLFEIDTFFHGAESESLCIHISDRDNTGQYKVFIDYQTALFTEAEIDSLFHHLINLLEDALHNPSKKICDLQLLSPEEERHILHDLNDTAIDFAEDKTIHQLFEEQVARTPERTAIVFNGVRMTYRELDTAANQLAGVLRKCGVGPESIVGLLAGRSPNMIIGILAILKAGAAYLPLDPNYPEDRIRFILEDSETQLVLCEEHLAEKVSGCRVIDINQARKGADYASGVQNLSVPGGPAYVIYTSGSTGKPKGVMIAHRSVSNFFKAMTMQVNLLNKVVLSITTVCFDIFVFETLLPLVHGSTVVIADEEQQVVPEMLAQVILNNGVNIVQTTPSRMQMLLLDERAARALENLTDIILGGEPIPETLLASLRNLTRARIFNGYGPTESTVYATFKEITDDDQITIGRPVANTRVYIMDPRLRPLPIDVAGELCLGGEGLARGYLNRPELTAEKFVTCPYLGGERIYRTGDLAKWGYDGNLHFLGRMDHQIKLRGFRIELGEIENVLRGHEAIREAVVLDQEDERGDKFLAAYLVARNRITIAELRGYLAKQLPDYMIPAAFVFVDEIPLNPNGKINRQALVGLYTDTGTAANPYVKPRNEVDETLAESWRQVLPLERVGIDDNFFEIGGDSLKIVKILVSLLPFNYDLTARDFYRYQTIRGLSDKIRGEVEETWEGPLTREIAVVPPMPALEAIDIGAEKVDLKNVLLTGATGYLGAHLLKELLTNTDAQVYCLVRGANQADAENRLLKAINFYFSGELASWIGKRIHVVPGDLTREHWGLSGDDYRSLARIIDTVFHSAAIVRHYGGYAEFARVNVEGTRGLVEFCSRYGQRLHHISTTSVSGRYLVKQNLGDIRFTENDFYVGQHYYENVYVRSKFEAENIILKAMGQDLEATIHRIGMLAGRYADGHFQVNIEDNAFYNRLKSILHLGVVPEEYANQEFELTPVDYCSRALVLLASIKDSANRVYHLFNHKTIPLARFLQVLQTCGYSIDVADRGSFDLLIRQVFSDPSQRGMLTGIINDLNFSKTGGLQDAMVIDSTITQAFLGRLGFDWPEIDEIYVGKIINYMRSVGFIDL